MRDTRTSTHTNIVTYMPGSGLPVPGTASTHPTCSSCQQPWLVTLVHARAPHTTYPHPANNCCTASCTRKVSAACTTGGRRTAMPTLGLPNLDKQDRPKAHLAIQPACGASTGAGETHTVRPHAGSQAPPPASHVSRDHTSSFPVRPDRTCSDKPNTQHTHGTSKQKGSPARPARAAGNSTCS